MSEDKEIIPTDKQIADYLQRLDAEKTTIATFKITDEYLLHGFGDEYLKRDKEFAGQVIDLFKAHFENVQVVLLNPKKEEDYRYFTTKIEIRIYLKFNGNWKSKKFMKPLDNLYNDYFEEVYYNKVSQVFFYKRPPVNIKALFYGDNVLTQNAESL